MTIYDLRQFEALVNYQNYAIAARALHVSASALSHGIRDLEEELHTTLFERRGDGVVLTESGTQLMHYAQQIFREEDDLQIRLNDLKDCFANPLHITIRMGFYPQRRLLRAFQDRYPQSRLIIYQHEQGNMTNFPWDLTFLSTLRSTGPDHAVRLMRETFRVAMRREHPLSSRSEISVSDLAPYPGIHLNLHPAILQNVEELFGKAGVNPRYVMYTDHFQLVLKMLEKQNCWAILPQYSMIPRDREDLVSLPVKGMDLSRTIYLGYNPNRTRSQVSLLFEEFTKEYFADWKEEPDDI